MANSRYLKGVARLGILIALIAAATYWYQEGGSIALQRFFTGIVHHEAGATWTVYRNAPFGYAVSVPPGYAYDETGDPTGRIVNFYPATPPGSTITIFADDAALGDTIATIQGQVPADDTETSSFFAIPGYAQASRFTFSSSTGSEITEKTIFEKNGESFILTLSTDDKDKYQAAYNAMASELIRDSLDSHS